MAIMRQFLLTFAAFSLVLVASAQTSTESFTAPFPASLVAGSTSTDYSALASQTPSLETAPASQTLASSVLSSIFSSSTAAPNAAPAITASADATSSIPSLASSTFAQATQTASPTTTPASPTTGPTLNTTIIVIIAVVAGALVLLAVGITAFCCIRRRNGRDDATQRGASTQPVSRMREYADLEKQDRTIHSRGPKYRGVEKLAPLTTEFGALSSDDAFSSPVKPVAPRAALHGRPVKQERQPSSSRRKKQRNKSSANINKDLPLGPLPDPYALGQSPDDDAEAGMLGLSPESPLSLLANGRFSHQLRSAAADRNPIPPPPPPMAMGAGASRNAARDLTFAPPPPPAPPSQQQQQQQQQQRLPTFMASLTSTPPGHAYSPRLPPGRAYSPSLYSQRDSMVSGARAPSSHLIVSEHEASRFSFGFGGPGPAPAPAFPTAANLAAARRGSTLGVPGQNHQQRPGSMRSVASGGQSSVFESAPWPPSSWAATGATHVGRWV